MKIQVSSIAAKSGIMRIRLKRIPIASETIYACRVSLENTHIDVIAQANIYGRGNSSSAREQVMLIFQFSDDLLHGPITAGEQLELCVTAPTKSGYTPINLDIHSVE